MAHILIVEDDSTLQKVYSEVLRKEGFEVTIVSTGPEAMKAIANDHVSIVLLDIMLPGGMNGFEILSQIKNDERVKKVPVIIMTNLDSEKKTGMELGATDYFFKPDLNLHGMINKINEHLPKQNTQ